MNPQPELMTVELLELPVPLWAKAQEQTDALLREFALIAEALRGEASDVGSAVHRDLPLRLLALIDSLTARFDGFNSEPEQQLDEALRQGAPTLERLTFRVPAEAAEASRVLGDMLDEADDYCRAGQHLLTLAADGDAVRFRRWYLLQFVTQVAGEPPVPWPAYDGSWPAPAAS